MVKYVGRKVEGKKPALWSEPGCQGPACAAKRPGTPAGGPLAKDARGRPLIGACRTEGENTGKLGKKLALRSSYSATLR